MNVVKSAEPMGIKEAIGYGITEHVRTFREAGAEARQYRRDNPEDPGYVWIAEGLASSSELSPAIRQVANDILNDVAA